MIKKKVTKQVSLFSKEEILNRYGGKVNCLDIYEKYIGKQLTVPCTIKSPLPNHPETNPSFTLYYSGQGVNWKDWTLNKSGDVIEFVMMFLSIDYNTALQTIAEDFQFAISRRKTLSTSINLQIITQPLTKTDYKYWSLRIDDADYWLERNNTFSVQTVLRNNAIYWIYRDTNPIYGYKYVINDDEKWKLYRPMMIEKKKKFYSGLTGLSHKCLHGLWNLPQVGEKLIITKSAKDTIVLDSFEFNVIGVQSEGSIYPIDNDIYLDLKERFKHIYLLYDNDWDKRENWGQNNAEQICEQYGGLINIYIPSLFECTDVDELVLKVGRNRAKEVINDLMK